MVSVAAGCTKILGLDYTYQGTGGQGTTTTGTGGGMATSTGTSTGTGDAGSCGAYVWDTLAMCDACMKSSCCAELRGCDTGTPCASLAACALACTPGNDACLSTCINADENQHGGSGLTAWNTLLSCFGTHCDTTTQCPLPVCGSSFLWPTRTCADCLGNDQACCAAFTACANDPVCVACETTTGAMGCSTNMNFQKTSACETQTCGVQCDYLICDSTTFGYTSSDCNYCLSKATGGCCTEFDACVTNTMSTCYACMAGTTTTGCSTDMLYTAYNNCMSANCSIECAGF
jgi:hypothetical protein